MVIEPGDSEIGPPASSIHLRTYRQGIAAKAGHDLLLEARTWHGHVHLPEEGVGAATFSIEIDMRSLYVLEGTGGLKPLSASDREKIHETMAKTLRSKEHPSATFTSEAVTVDGERATVEGTLSLAGQSHPLRLELTKKDDSTVTGRTDVVQSTWGVKPYVGFFGALRLRDDVEVEVSVSL